MKLTLILICLAAAPAWGQPAPAAPDSSAWVRVEGAGGAVVVDDQPAGAPGDWLPVAPGTRTVALVDDLQVWNPRRASRTLDLGAGDSVSVALALPLRTRVETLPIRALVVREDGGRRDTLGIAPLTLELAPGERATLAATLDGFDAARATVQAGEPATLMLAPAAGTVPDVALLPTERSTARRTLIDVSLGAAALAAGAVAVHFKFRADAVDDRYRGDDPADRGDESLRQEALRLDRISAVALGAMQVGLGALALRFVLR